eukprot:4898793-Amphidinium_carterae.1
MRRTTSRSAGHRVIGDRARLLDVHTQTCESACDCSTDHDNDDFILVSSLSQTPVGEVQLPLRSSNQQAVASSGSAASLSCAGSASTRRSHPASPSSSSARAVPAPCLLSEVCGLPCGRVYIVWCVPDSPFGDISGVHFGIHSWTGIESCIPGRHYRSGQDRLRALVLSFNV